MVTLSARAKELGTYAVTCVCYDETGEVTTPATAVWDWTDEDGTVINSRSSESIAIPSTSMVVVLTNADLAITNKNKLKRIFTLRYTYNSSYGTGLTGTDECAVFLEELINVTT